MWDWNQTMRKLSGVSLTVRMCLRVWQLVVESLNASKIAPEFLSRWQRFFFPGSSFLGNQNLWIKIKMRKTTSKILGWLKVRFLELQFCDLHTNNPHWIWCCRYAISQYKIYWMQSVRIIVTSWHYWLTRYSLWYLELKLQYSCISYLDREKGQAFIVFIV